MPLTVYLLEIVSPPLKYEWGVRIKLYPLLTGSFFAARFDGGERQRRRPALRRCLLASQTKQLLLDNDPHAIIMTMNQFTNLFLTPL